MSLEPLEYARTASLPTPPRVPPFIRRWFVIVLGELWSLVGVALVIAGMGVVPFLFMDYWSLRVIWWVAFGVILYYAYAGVRSLLRRAAGDVPGMTAAVSADVSGVAGGKKDTSMADDAQERDEARAPPQPVLPYSAQRGEAVPPVDEVYGGMGTLALVLSLVCWSYTIAMMVLGPNAPEQVARIGFCCAGLLPWAISLSIAVRVSMRSHAGRWTALLALLLDVGLAFWIALGIRV